MAQMSKGGFSAIRHKQWSTPSQRAKALSLSIEERIAEKVWAAAAATEKTGTMFYASKEELEAAERRPKGHVAYRRKRDGAWIYVKTIPAQGSAAQRRRDAIMREKYEAAMREKASRNLQPAAATAAEHGVVSAP